MKIVHLIPYLTSGGVELHLLTLTASQMRLGVSPLVVTLQGKVSDGACFLEDNFQSLGVPVEDLGLRGKGDFRGFSRLSRILREHNPDVLHSHLPRADLLGALVRGVGFQGAWVCSVHDVYRNSWRGRWMLPLLGQVWRRADQIIAISEAVKKWLVQGYRLPPEKIQVVYYGIEPERWASHTWVLHGTWGLIGKPLIGTIGRLEPRKGHDVLIQAMPLIVRQFPQAMLLIAGHDPWGYRRVLERLAIQLGMESHVRLLGFQGDIPSFLHAVDVFAFASRSEGFGQVVIEAMAAGRPVVVSRIAPLTEIVVDGETGFWAEPESPKDFAEKILWLLSHPHEVRHMVEKAQQRVRECFSAEVMANKTLDIYRKVRQ